MEGRKKRGSLSVAGYAIDKLPSLNRKTGGRGADCREFYSIELERQRGESEGRGTVKGMRMRETKRQTVKAGRPKDEGREKQPPRQSEGRETGSERERIPENEAGAKQQQPEP